MQVVSTGHPDNQGDPVPRATVKDQVTQGSASQLTLPREWTCILVSKRHKENLLGIFWGESCLTFLKEPQGEIR